MYHLTKCAALHLCSNILSVVVEAVECVFFWQRLGVVHKVAEELVATHLCVIIINNSRIKMLASYVLTARSSLLYGYSACAIVLYFAACDFACTLLSVFPAFCLQNLSKCQ